MDASTPLISVIVTSYNYDAYLATALESVLNQDYPNLDIIVLDNASTDRSREIIRRYSTDDRMRVFEHPVNIGALQNHNYGIEQARGEKLLFLSADDAFLPDSVSRLQAYAARNPEADIVYAGIYWIDEGGHIFPRDVHPGIIPVSYAGGRNEFADLFTFGPYLCMPSVLFPKYAFERCGVFDDTLIAADFEIYARFAAAGLTFAYLHSPTVRYRMHAANLSRHTFISDGEQIKQHVSILSRHLTPSNFWRLIGYSQSVLRELDRRVETARSHPNAAQCLPALMPEIENLRAVLASIPTRAASQPASRAPQVSVIVPTTGRLHLLDQALRSISEQTFEDWEVVLVSDSDLDLQSYLTSLAYAHKVRYFRHERTYGPAAARNTALRLARGDVIFYLDDDNRYAPSHVQACLNALAGEANAVFSGSLLEIYRYRFEAVRMPELLLSDEDAFLTGTLALELNSVGNTIPLNAVAHRRTCLDRYGFQRMDLPLLEDWEFVRRITGREQTAFTAVRTTFISQFAQFETQHFGANASRYVSAINAVYGANLTHSVEIGHARQRYAESVLRSLQDAANTGDAEAVRRFTRILTGRDR